MFKKLAQFFIFTFFLVSFVAQPSRAEEEKLDYKLAVNLLVEAMNSLRADAGLPLFIASPELFDAALGHCEEMVKLNFFSSKSPTASRRTVMMRLALAGVQPQRAAQRVYAKQENSDLDLAQNMLQDWLKSPKIEKLIRSANYNHLGLGMAHSSGERFCSLVFAEGPLIKIDANKEPELILDSKECLDLADRVLLLSNKTRARANVGPLARSEALRKAALDHSEEMQVLGYFAHRSPTPGREKVRNRINLQGKDPNAVAENLYQCTGYPPDTIPNRAIQAWLDSPGHRANLLSDGSTHVGIGVAAKGRAVYITQVFSDGD